jgi:hypothetical protein
MLIENHLKACKSADIISQDYYRGMTELEYHMAKIVDRLCIDYVNRRFTISLRLEVQHEKV